MKRLFVFTVSFFCFISTTLSQEKLFSLSGLIIDSESDRPSHGAIVFIKELSLGAAANFNGFYQLDSIPIGTYEIEINALGHIIRRDTLTFNQDIQKDYIVHSEIQIVKLEQTDEMRKYHLDLLRSAKDKPVMEFTIDSLEYEEAGYLWFYSTFKNNTDHPIYILKENDCIKPFRFYIYNVDGKSINKNMISLACDQGYYYGPDSLDLIEISPLSEYQYPKTEVWLYNFKRLQEDEFIISAEYEYKDPLIIRKGYGQSLEEISSKVYTARIGLRGRYITKERIHFYKKR